MTTIQLTEEHKSKLLEMCKVLFPEYIETYLGVNDYDLEPDGYIYFIKNKNITRIHWFEFCMTHLIEKLFNSFEEDDEEFYNRYINNGASFYGIGVNEIIFVMLSSQKHPVDYLYEEFKKLKS